MMIYKKIYLFLILSIIIIFFIIGCMKVDTTLHVNKDGSGQIEVIMCTTKQIAEVLANMNKKSETDKVEVKNLYPKEEFEKMQADYGEVKLKSYKEYEDEIYLGGIGIYTFNDVEKVNAYAVPDSESQGGGEEKKKENPTKFKFEKKGKKGILYITGPEKDEEKKEVTEEEKEKNMQQAESMKNFFKDMYISFKIIVDGKIVKTDSSRHTENSVTLIDFDFNKILEEEDRFKKFIEISSEDKNDAWKQFNDIEGIYYEEKEEILIEFE